MLAVILWPPARKMVIEAFRLVLGVPDDLVIFIQLLKVSTVYADMCSVVVETQSFIGNDVTLCTLGKKGSFLLRWSLNAWRINSTQKLFVLLIVASWELPIGLTGYHSNIIVLTIFWEKRFVEQTCLLLDSMYLSPPNISARLARVLLDPFPDRCIFLVILLIWQGITSLYALNHLPYLNSTEPATSNRSRTCSWMFLSKRSCLFLLDARERS